jgi:DNA-binding MarR family transcriptional regulator
MRTVRLLRRETDGEHSVSFISLLSSLQMSGPVTLSRLAEVEGITRPSMSALAKSLFDKELIAKEADPRDGRIVRVHITQLGKRALDGSKSRRDAYLATVLQGLSESDLRILDQAAVILQRLTDHRS